MPRESKDDTKRRVRKITVILSKEFGKAGTALNYSNPLELLVGTILSAQCTDKRVNIVTKDLFKKYKAPQDYAGCEQEALEEEIRTTGFYRNKARSIRTACAKIVDDFGGEVPDSMEDLLTLPGVARKTANVVLGEAFKKQQGIAVDTHVIRISCRLKLTTHKTNQGDKIEKDLMELVPRKNWSLFSNVLILHGRRTCTARKPDCAGCPINHLCPLAFNV